MPELRLIWAHVIIPALFGLLLLIQPKYFVRRGIFSPEAAALGSRSRRWVGVAFIALAVVLAWIKANETNPDPQFPRLIRNAGGLEESGSTLPPADGPQS